MAAPSPDDEQTHVPTADRFYAESYYFNLFDASAGLAVATRIGFEPNRGRVEGFVLVHLPDGRAGFVRVVEGLEATAHGRPNQPIAVGPLRFTLGSPFGRWQVAYEGPLFVPEDPTAFSDPMRVACVDVPRVALRLDLTFDALHEPWDFHGRSRKRLVLPPARVWVDEPVRRLGGALRALRALPSMAGAAHYEQAVRVRGEVVVDGRPIDVVGTGQRDHSHGVRDMRVPSGWRWISFQLGEDFAVNATRVRVLALEVSSGYVFRGGSAASVRGFTMSEDVGPDGRFPPRFELRLALDDETIGVEVEILRTLPIAVDTEGHGSVVDEALARFHHGGRSALGFVEAMRQRCA